MMLAGGTEATGHEALVAGFAAMRALSTRNDDPDDASRPFDTGRDGFVIGEGAASSSWSRSITPGHAASSRSPRSSATAPPPMPRTSPCPRRAGRGGSGGPPRIGEGRPQRRRRDPGQRPRHFHAGGRPRELEAIQTLFGERAGDVSVTANKSMLGHTLGAAGAIEAIATILSIRTGVLPPTINLDHPDDAAAGLDLTPNKARQRDVEVAVSNSFGFGGQNSALVFRRWAE